MLVDLRTRRFAARRSDTAAPKDVSKIAVLALTGQVAYRPCVPAGRAGVAAT